MLNNTALSKSASGDTCLALQPLGGSQADSFFCTLISRWVILREMNPNL